MSWGYIILLAVVNWSGLGGGTNHNREACRLAHVSNSNIETYMFCYKTRRDDLVQTLRNLQFQLYDLFHILLSCDKIMDPWNVCV
jgi:hypothetical protein